MSNKYRLWWTSDTHLDHENIIKYCNRPFKNKDEMNEYLIERWNSVVDQHDVVWHLGDILFSDRAHLLYRLNGTIHLVLGNHDHLKDLEKSKAIHRFDSVQTYKEINYVHENGDKQNIVMFHYGLRTWHHDLRGTWMLYGHSHNELPAYGKSVDVGVDNPLWGFTPVSYEQLKKFMEKQPIGKHPQFDKFNNPPQF
jgi:calcineurin-like phosphoesterase family protein